MALVSEPVRPTERETQEAQGIEERLRGLVGQPILVSGGERFELPEFMFRILKKTVHLLAQGHAVAIVPYYKLLTTQQAAELLNISRPYLIRLLEEGKIPYQMVRTHRRIRFDDLMRYREQRDAQRRHFLEKASQLGQKLGKR